MRCPHCKKLFASHLCFDDPAAQPEDGDVGVCRNCGGWWERTGESFVTYMPSKAEMQMLIPRLTEIHP